MTVPLPQLALPKHLYPISGLHGILMSQLCVYLLLICSLPYLWRDFPSGANAPHFAVAFASIGVDTGDSDRLCLPTNEKWGVNTKEWKSRVLAN